jgi:DNA repair exonuclease SbcCD ATPase subunit
MADTNRWKDRQHQKSRIDQRTRERLPVLPALVRTVEQRHREATERLQAAQNTAPGATFTAAGVDYRRPVERRLRTQQQAGEQTDPRDAQITRLKNEVTALKHRLVGATSTINELTEFRTQALARLAAQHDEITQLRNVLAGAHQVRSLPLYEVTSSAASDE